MTPEKQRIALAEFCGFNTNKEQIGGVFIYRDKNGQMVATLPNYLSDLNAIHEAESKLTQDQGTRFGLHLNSIMERDSSKGIADPHGDCDWHATSAQRSKALLRTIGRWEEETLP